jgi:hypothetical protein
LNVCGTACNVLCVLQLALTAVVGGNAFTYV